MYRWLLTEPALEGHLTYSQRIDSSVTIGQDNSVESSSSKAPPVSVLEGKSDSVYGLSRAAG